MTVTQVIGVDPGLVDTGVVRLTFKPNLKTLMVEHEVVAGTDADIVKEWIHRWPQPTKYIFVEQYRPRLKLDSDQRMVQAEQDIRRALPDAKFLPNMGIKRVIPQSLMEVFGVWSWPTVTHHQDLRSAARIALLGMVKDERLNPVMAAVVRDHLDSLSWNVSHV